MVPLVREGSKPSDGRQNFRGHVIGGVEAPVGNKVPDLFKVERRFRVKIVARHDRGVDRRAALFSRKRAMTSSPGTGFTLPLFKSS